MDYNTQLTYRAANAAVARGGYENGHRVKASLVMHVCAEPTLAGYRFPEKSGNPGGHIILVVRIH